MGWTKHEDWALEATFNPSCDCYWCRSPEKVEVKKVEIEQVDDRIYAVVHFSDGDIEPVDLTPLLKEGKR